jgi:hypothetical protein
VCQGYTRTGDHQCAAGKPLALVLAERPARTGGVQVTRRQPVVSPRALVRGALPGTIADLESDLQGGAGQAWSKVYFWLHFNQGYIVSIEAYQAGPMT